MDRSKTNSCDLIWRDIERVNNLFSLAETKNMINSRTPQKHIIFYFFQNNSYNSLMLIRHILNYFNVKVI